MKTTLGALLAGNCEYMLRLNHLVSTHSLYKNKAMRHSGPLLDNNRDVSEACVTHPLVEIGQMLHGITAVDKVYMQG